MPRIPFQKPRKVEWEILTDRYGRLVAEPFEKGYALTVGHSLRRTLLNIVPGSAVSWVKIDGVRTADQPIAGVTESTADVLLNLKKLTIQVPAGEPRTVRVEVSGPKTVTGADVPETDIEVINPETHLFTLGAGAKVSMELGIGVGRGYEALGKMTDYEKLVIEIWTNGAVSPEDALERAAGFLRGHFSPLAAGAPVEEAETEGASGEEYLRDALSKPLEELPLPARAINALKNAEIHVVADLAQKTEADLEQVKNLGEKSIDEIKTALAALGLSIGMRIDPNILGTLNRGGGVVR